MYVYTYNILCVHTIGSSLFIPEFVQSDSILLANYSASNLKSGFFETTV